MTRVLAGVGFGLIVALLISVVVLAFQPTRTTTITVYVPRTVVVDRTVEVPVIPPCEYEDSTNCFWDAGESGNGRGVSFVDVNGEAYYLPIKPIEGVFTAQSADEDPCLVYNVLVQNGIPTHVEPDEVC